MKIALQIIKLSIKDTFRGQVWKYLSGSIGAFSALLLFGKNFLSTGLDTSIKIGFGILICLFVCRFLLFGLKNSFKHLHHVYRESKYGNAIILLKVIFAKIHGLRRKGDFSDDDLMKTLRFLCNQLHEFFSKKAMCDCCVSIKVPVRGSITEKASVQNLCRDSNHTDRDTDEYKSVDHTIIGNTPYRKIVNNVLRKNGNYHYLNNNIPNTKDYDNTSKEAYKNGVLPYKSEIVVPIMSFGADNNFDILGFLCVDCKKENAFDEKYDPLMLEGIVDGIYDLFVKLIKK
jgi:hypothetical protein